MILSAEYKRKALICLKTFGLALLIFYFGYHTMLGDKGVIAMIQMQQKVAAARIELAQVHAGRMKLERKVSMLYPHSLDADLLDEQARRLLGHVGKGEIVIMRPTR